MTRKYHTYRINASPESEEWGRRFHRKLPSAEHNEEDIRRKTKTNKKKKKKPKQQQQEYEKWTNKCQIYLFFRHPLHACGELWSSKTTCAQFCCVTTYHTPLFKQSAGKPEGSQTQIIRAIRAEPEQTHSGVLQMLYKPPSRAHFSVSKTKYYSCSHELIPKDLNLRATTHPPHPPSLPLNTIKLRQPPVLWKK